MTDETLLDSLMRPAQSGVGRTLARFGRRLKAYGILRRRRWSQSTGFTSAFVVLAAKMAAADGVAVSSEAAMFEQFLDVKSDELPRLRRVYEQAAADVTGYEI
jgi:DnaJ like chaperone protein